MADIETIAEAVRIKFERGQAEHAGQAGDWEEWTEADFRRAVIAELLDIIAYTERMYHLHMLDRKMFGIKFSAETRLLDMDPADVLAAAYGSVEAWKAAEEAASDE